MESAHLSLLEEQVLSERFGLPKGRPRTLAEIGREVGKSPQQVWRIERRALKKTRSSGEYLRMHEEFGEIRESLE